MSRSLVSINLDPILSSLTELEKRSFRKAEAFALTETAFQARGALIGVMPQRFTLRSQRPLKGYRVGRAEARQHPIRASVFHLDAWMAIHEPGGVKTSNSGKAMGVPAQEVQDKGRGAGGKIRSRWWPRNMRKDAGFADPRAAGRMGGRGNKGRGNPKPFLMRSRNGAVTIVRRTTRETRGTDRQGSNRWNLVDLYYLKRAVKIRPRWDFARTVERVAAQQLGPQLERALFRLTAFRS